MVEKAIVNGDEQFVNAKQDLVGEHSLILRKLRFTMDWQDILIIVIVVLLLGVWLPALIISVCRSLRKSKQNRNNS
jgi:hypothetical protein